MLIPSKMKNIVPMVISRLFFLLVEYRFIHLFKELDNKICDEIILVATIAANLSDLKVTIPVCGFFFNDIMILNFK